MESLISIVVPVFNEEEVLPEFYRRLKTAIANLQSYGRFQIVFVNDGSTDRSFDLLKKIQKEDRRILAISLSRNFGHQKAITAGIDHAVGDAVITIDADLQDPPELIGALIQQWKAGFKVVYGIRKNRDTDSFFKKWSAALFYKVIFRLSDTPIIQQSGDFRLMDKAVVHVLRSMKEEHRFIRGMVSWIGFPQSAVFYDRDVRFAGKTKYSLRKMMSLALDGISGFSEKPLQFSSRVGAFSILLSLAFAIKLIIGKLLYPETVVQGWTSVMLIILFMGGIQLFSVGILGEYIGRLYKQSKNRPIYIIEEKTGSPE